MSRVGILSLFSEEFEILAADVPLSIIFEHVSVDELLSFSSGLLNNLHSLSFKQFHLVFAQLPCFFEHLRFPVVVNNLKRFL